MKKLFVSVLLAVILFTACCAAAERTFSYSNPTDPNFKRVHEVGRLGAPQKKQNLLDNIRLYLSGGLSVSSDNISESGNYYSGRTWTVTPTGGTAPYSYEFFICEQNSRFDESSVCYYQAPSTSNTLDYKFMVPGDYYLYCIVTDNANSTDSCVVYFTVPADGHQTLDNRVSQIVSQCRAADCTGDFDTALWLHDWLTANVYYDLDYHYYSAADALLRGKCVCDGYSKAYFLLLESAGIPVNRIISNAINHAWNVMKLNGQWYQVDVTWDDPAGTAKAVSGNEHHFYFGLPDELMVSDHQDYPSPVSCTSYADNYFIHTGKVSMWVDTLKDNVLNRLSASMWGSILDVPNSYPIEKAGYYSYGKEAIVYGLAAHQMSNTVWNVNGDKLRLNAFYSSQDKTMHVLVRVEDAELILPANLGSITAQSFMNNSSIMGVKIPDGTTSIGSKAFAGCANLWAVFVPDSVTYIDPTAFDNCNHVNIVCHSGSYAEQFAENNHLIKAII